MIDPSPSSSVTLAVPHVLAVAPERCAAPPPLTDLTLPLAWRSLRSGGCLLRVALCHAFSSIWRLGLPMASRSSLLQGCQGLRQRSLNAPKFSSGKVCSPPGFQIAWCLGFEVSRCPDVTLRFQVSKSPRYDGLEVSTLDGFKVPSVWADRFQASEASNSHVCKWLSLCVCVCVLSRL